VPLNIRVRESAPFGLAKNGLHCACAQYTALQRIDAKLSCGGFSQIFGHIGEWS
jgi:hypothetical protein